MLGNSREELAQRLLRHGWDGDESAALKILRDHPDLAGDSLFMAAACGDLSEVERHLARAPEEVDSKGGPSNWTALAYVTYSRLDALNALAIARRLLDAGADPNFRFDDGWGNAFTVLTGAIRLGEGSRPSHPQAEELVNLLIEAGADPFDLQALYNVSIVGKDTHWYELLWRHGEARGCIDKWRDPAAGRPGGSVGMSTINYLLGNAVGQNHLVRAEWLLARGADADTPHAYTAQPVHALAQLSGFLDIVALLERHGATPSSLQGVQAFQAACLRLDEAGARAPARRGFPGCWKIQRRCCLPRNSETRRPSPSCSRSARHRRPSVKRASARLHRAARSGNLAAVELLVAAGADVDLRDCAGRARP